MNLARAGDVSIAPQNGTKDSTRTPVAAVTVLKIASVFALEFPLPIALSKYIPHSIAKDGKIGRMYVFSFVCEKLKNRNIPTDQIVVSKRVFANWSFASDVRHLLKPHARADGRIKTQGANPYATTGR